MTDFSEDPFQMDDDFTGYNKISEDISPTYESIDEQSMRIDQEIIRSKIRNLEITPQPEYEEDIDDIYDPEQQKEATRKALQLGDGSLTPPENFAPVINNIYRSSFPRVNNFPFLKRLKLKAILCLIPEEYPEEHLEFFKEQGIQLFQLGLSGNKEPFVVISHDLITEALKIVLDPANQPILIHCNRGKHRTGCLVGVLRKLQNWSLTIIFDEYRRFAAPKERPMDQQFIELYDEGNIVKYCQSNQFLPLSWD